MGFADVKEDGVVRLADRVGVYGEEGSVWEQFGEERRGGRVRADVEAGLGSRFVRGPDIHSFGLEVVEG